MKIKLYNEYFSEINKLNSRGNKEGYWEEDDQYTLFLDDKSITLLVRKCNYKDGEYDGYCEFYHSYGLIKCNYVLGVRHGYYEYIVNGVVNTKGDYKNGNKEGYWVTYYPNGKLKEECNYDNRNYEGKYKTYYSSGKLESEGNYRNNLKNGYWVNYFEDGRISEECNYKNDYKIGFQICRNGKLYDRCFYFYDWSDENKYLKMSNDEINKINNFLHFRINCTLDEIYISDKDFINYDNYYYMFGRKLSFICKLEDDYYILFNEGIYIKCDQLSEVIKRLKKIFSNED